MTTTTQEKRISSFPAFIDVPEQAIARLDALAQEVRYAPGERILTKGDPGDRLYLLRQGRVVATVPASDGTPMQDPMGPGEVFGEMSLLTGETRSADIVAETEVMCLEVPFEPLRKLFSTNPEVAGFLTAIVGGRLLDRDGIRQVGPYEIGRRLGAGGFARVFVGLDPATGHQVAIKMLRHELVWREDFAERFRIEAAAIQGLVHPNIVRVFGVIEAYATLFIAMEFVPGRDLARHLRDLGPLSPSEVRHVFRGVALALQEAHDHGVIHRDIKPANILVTPTGDVKLADFGVALTPAEANAHGGGANRMFTGTPHYSAPEHVLDGKMDGRTDLFMLGVTAIELLTGKVPRDAETVSTVMLKRVTEELPDPRGWDGMPEDLGELIYRCTRRLPSARFNSCRAAIAFLDAAGGASVAPSAPAKPRLGVAAGAVPEPTIEFELTRSTPTSLEGLDSTIAQVSGGETD